MEKKRILDIDGSIDHSLSSLEELIEDLEEVYLFNTTKAIEELSKLKKETIESYKRLEDAGEIIEYIEYCIKMFQGVEYDLKRLLIEIPESLEERHIEILTQIHERCYYECKNLALEFKIDHIEKSLKDESLRPLLDEIYSVSRGAFYGNVFLGRLKKRLKTFIGTEDLIKDIALPSERKKHTFRPFQLTEGIKWDDVYLTFKSKEIVKIKINEIEEERDYAEFGLSDKRSGEPNLLWNILLNFAKNDRKIEAKYFQGKYLTEKQQGRLKSNIYRLRKHLRAFFRIKDDPIPCKKSIYTAEFHISIDKKPDSSLEPKAKLFTSDGINDIDIREVYETDIEKKIGPRKKKIDFAILEDVEGKKRKD